MLTLENARIPWGPGSRVYDHGLKFEKVLGQNLLDCIARVKNKKPSLIIIDGGSGEGKTTLATECAQFVAANISTNPEPFDIRAQVRMGGPDFLRGVQWCRQEDRHVVIYDEAGDFDSKSALTAFNKTLNRVFETYRKFGIIVILCLPSFKKLDKGPMENKIARMLINVHNRDDAGGDIRGWSLNRMWWIKSNMKTCVVPDDAYKKVEPNFRGHFLDLDPEDAEILDSVSTQGKDKISVEAMINNSGLVPVVTIARATGFSEPAVRRFMETRKIKGEKFPGMGRNLYYPKVVIELIGGAVARGENVTGNRKRKGTD